MAAQGNWPVAIIGSGDIGTDLMIKIQNSDGPLSFAAMADGVDGLFAMPHFGDIRIVFDATSGGADRAKWTKLADTGVRVLDLTPAASGPFFVPAVSSDDHLDAPNLSMVGCGGQAAVPIVAAVAQSAIVSYAEAVLSISAKAVGPDSREAISNFTEITAAAMEVVGCAQRGKAMLILSPAAPPMPMRTTVHCLITGDADHQRIESDVSAVVDRVTAYVPGYRLKQRIQFETFSMTNPLYIPETGKFTGTAVTVLVEINGAADYLPHYAGNVDMVTAAAKATAERIAAHVTETVGLPT